MHTAASLTRQVYRVSPRCAGGNEWLSGEGCGVFFVSAFSQQGLGCDSGAASERLGCYVSSVGLSFGRSRADRLDGWEIDVRDGVVGVGVGRGGVVWEAGVGRGGSREEWRRPS